VILVTGATGKVGQEVVRQLAAADVPLRAFVRDPLRASHIRLPGVQIAVGDLSKPETLDVAMEGIERVFLLSAPDPDQVNLQSNAIDSARRMGARHVVKVSVAGGPDAGTQIGRWHWTTETQLKDSGLVPDPAPDPHMQQPSSSRRRSRRPAPLRPDGHRGGRGGGHARRGRGGRPRADRVGTRASDLRPDWPEAMTPSRWPTSSHATGKKITYVHAAGVRASSSSRWVSRAGSSRT
jgi:hypothetical protein